MTSNHPDDDKSVTEISIDWLRPDFGPSPCAYCTALSTSSYLRDTCPGGSHDVDTFDVTKYYCSRPCVPLLMDRLWAAEHGPDWSQRAAKRSLKDIWRLRTELGLSTAVRCKAANAAKHCLKCAHSAYHRPNIECHWKCEYGYQDCPCVETEQAVEEVSDAE